MLIVFKDRTVVQSMTIFLHNFDHISSKIMKQCFTILHLGHLYH